MFEFRSMEEQTELKALNISIVASGGKVFSFLFQQS